MREVTKICPRCKCEKSIEQFCKNPNKKLGIGSWCKECSRKYNKEYRRKHKSKINKLQRKYRKRSQLKNPYRMWARASLGCHRSTGYKTEITIDELEILARKSFHCPYCGKKLNYFPEDKKLNPNSPTLDRINNELILTINNVKILCYQCNISKSNRTEKEFFEFCRRLVEKFNIK